MSQWILFRKYDPKSTDDRQVLINMDLVERIYPSDTGAYFEFFTADGRTEKIVCTADELLLITNAQVLVK